jgi:hypothetical protein
MGARRNVDANKVDKSVLRMMCLIVMASEVPVILVLGPTPAITGHKKQSAAALFVVRVYDIVRQ